MKTRGFTLIEAIVAMALLAVGLLGLLYIFEGTASNALLPEQSYVATNLAREALETIVARRDCTLSGCGYASTLAAIQASSYNQSPVSGFSGYNLTVTAVEVDAEAASAPTNFTVPLASSGYALVTATVTFNNGTNSVTLKTLMANYT